MRTRITQRGIEARSAGRSAAGAFMPFAVGTLWTGVAAVLLGTQLRGGLPSWSVWALGVAGLAGPVVFVMGVEALLTVTRFSFDRVTRRSVWSLGWVFAPFAVRRRVEFGAEAFDGLFVERPRGDDRWFVRLKLRGPARQLDLGAFGSEEPARAALAELEAALGEDLVRTPREPSPSSAPVLVSQPLDDDQLGLLDLEEGEEVLWTQKPSPIAFAARAGAWPTMLFGFVWLGVVVGAGVGPIGSIASAWGGSGAVAVVAQALFMGAFGWPGLAMITSPAWSLVIALRTSYVLTTHGLIVLDGRLLGPAQPTRCKKSIATRLQVETLADGTGHVMFDEHDGLLGLDEPGAVASLIKTTLESGSGSKRKKTG